MILQIGRKMTEFNAAAEAAEIRAISKLRKKRQYPNRKSILDKYRKELLALYLEQELSCTQLKIWLKEKKRLDVSLSTITRWIKKYG